MSKPDTKNEVPAPSAAFPTELEVDEANPWKDDWLGREKIAETLTNLAENAMTENANSAFVMSVHGGWGTGKTFMLKRMRQQLKNDKRIAIYFNAWEGDFDINPLTAIIGQLRQPLIGGWRKQIGNWLKQPMKTLVLSVSMAWKLFFNYMLNRAGLKEGDVSSDAQKILKNYNSSRKDVKQLRRRLIALTNKAREQTEFPLVFIVDELDRCRPTFALEVLERVKHLFNVPGIVFIFGINKKSLEESIKVVYGNIDAPDYLRRFFQLELNLPPVDSGKFAQKLLEEHHVIEFLVNAKFTRGWEEPVEMGYLTLVRMMGLTLREIEYSIRLISLALRGWKQENRNRNVEGWAVICLVLLKIKLPELYGEFVRGECRCKKVIDEMEKIMRGDDKFNDVVSMRDVMNALFYHLVSSKEEQSQMKEELDAFADSGINVKGKDISCLSETVRNGGQERAKGVKRLIDRVNTPVFLDDVVSLLDLVSDSSQG